MNLKLIKLSFIVALSGGMIFTGCKDPVDPPPPPSTDAELSGSLNTMTLDAGKEYLIKGTVIVGDGVTLTIPAGTILKGEKKSKGTLVIAKGGKIMAEGTEQKPIIFTSNQEPGEREQGDWGGLLILGKANVNQNNPAIEGISPAVNYGTFNSTANDNDNSGILKYVRIEYAGIALTPNNETNSLTLGAVGSGTTIDYVQCTYGGDDSYEWFGGTVNCSHLISLAAWDDDFDNDFGYSGKVQFALAIRDPFNADQSGSNGFEVDNDASGTTATPKTACVYSNVTLLGPGFDSSKNNYSPNYGQALHLRRNCEISLFNSVFTGFPAGLNLDGTLANYTGGMGVLDKNILVITGNAVKKTAARPFMTGSSTSTAVQDYFLTTKSNQVFTLHQPTAGTPAYSKAFADAGIPVELIMGYNTTAGSTSGTYPANPNFASFGGATQSGAAFTDAKVSSWFTPTTFKGAFGSTDWTDNWSNFNPQLLPY